MEKAKFNNELYYWFVILLIGGFFIWNLTVVLQGQLIGILPITIQAILMTLIVTRNKYVQIAIKIWSFVFMVIASGLQLVGRLMIDTVKNFAAFDAIFYIKVLIQILVGLLIFIYAKKTIEIVTVEENDSEDL